MLPQRAPAGRVVEAPERRVVARPPDKHDLVVTVPACGDLPDDPRLMAAVQEYLGLLEAGRRPDRREFLGRYPDLTGPLAQASNAARSSQRVSTR